LFAEGAGGVAEKLPHHPEQGLGMGYRVALYDISQQDNVDVAAQEFDTVAQVEALGFGESALRKKGVQLVVEGRPLGFGEVGRRVGGFAVGVAQAFAEAEREDNGFHGASAHAGGHLAREQPCRRAGEVELDVFAIQDSAGKGFPSGNDLDFVKEQGNLAPIPGFGVQPEIFFEQDVQVPGLHTGEAFVLEAEIEQGVARSASGKAVVQNLPHQAGLARAAHADHRNCLVGQVGNPDIAPRQRRWKSGDGVDDLLADDWPELAFHEH